MHKLLGRVLFHQTEFLSRNECKKWQAEPFVLGFHNCFQNACIIRVCVMDRADILIHSRIVLSPPRLPTSFSLSNIYVNGHVLQLTLYMILFNSSFVSRSLGFLKTWPNVSSSKKAVLMFSLFKIPSNTSLTYGINANAFRFSWGFGCTLIGQSTNFTKFSG